MKYLVLLVLTLLQHAAMSQSWLWATNPGDKIPAVVGISVDKWGNAYTVSWGTGTYENKVIFNNGSASGGILAKYDRNGGLIWVFDMGNFLPAGINVNDSGFVFVIGTGGSELKGMTNKLSVADYKNGDPIIGKYEPNGNLIWASCYSDNQAIPTNLKLKADPFGNCILCYNATKVDNSLLSRIGVKKINRDGTLIWEKTSNWLKGSLMNSVRVDNSGNVIMAGNISDTISFNDAQLISNNSNIRTFIAKFSKSGSTIFMKDYLNNGCIPRCMCVDKSNNIVLSGSFNDSCRFDNVVGNSFINSTNKIFVTKLDSMGKAVWVSTATGLISNDMEIDINDGIVVTGGINQTAKFDLSTISITPVKKMDIFVVSFDKFGIPQMAVVPSGSNEYFNAATALATGPYNNSWLTGSLGSQTKFDEITLVGSSTNIGFIARIGDKSTVGLSSQKYIDNIQIYPVPSGRYVNIDLNGRNTLSPVIRVYNVVGEEMFGLSIIEEAGGSYKLDCITLPKGVYFVQVNSNNVGHPKKIIIQ